RDGKVAGSEERHRLGDRSLQGLAIRHVGLQNDRAPAEGAYLGGRLLRRLPVAAVVDRHVGPLASELEYDTPTDAPATSGHECRLAVELSHLTGSPGRCRAASLPAPDMARRQPCRHPT